jgi:hypothetical protein
VHPLSEPLSPASDLAPRRLSLVPDGQLLTDTAPGPLSEQSGTRETDTVLATHGKTCSCGHTKLAHSHYRRGTDCAQCSCSRFHRPLLSRLRALSR